MPFLDLSGPLAYRLNNESIPYVTDGTWYASKSSSDMTRQMWEIEVISIQLNDPICPTVLLASDPPHKFLTTATVQRYADRLCHDDWVIDPLRLNAQLGKDIVQYCFLQGPANK